MLLWPQEESRVVARPRLAGRQGSGFLQQGDLSCTYGAPGSGGSGCQGRRCTAARQSLHPVGLQDEARSLVWGPLPGGSKQPAEMTV